MSFDDLRTGVVVDYPFLWSHEAGRGRLEGSKIRPTAVGFRLPRRSGGDVLLLFPITTKEPPPERFAVEIPEAEKRRGGLSVDQRLWLILDEFNEDVVGESFHLIPGEVRGQLGRAFFLPLMKAFIARRAAMRGTSRR